MLTEQIKAKREELQQLIDGETEPFAGSGDVGDAIVSLEQAERRLREAAESAAIAETAPEAAGAGATTTEE